MEVAEYDELDGKHGFPDDGHIWPDMKEEELEEAELLHLRLRRAARHIEWQAEARQTEATWRAYLQEKRALLDEAARDQLRDRAVAAEDQAAAAELQVTRARPSLMLPLHACTVHACMEQPALPQPSQLALERLPR